MPELLSVGMIPQAVKAIGRHHHAGASEIVLYTQGRGVTSVGGRTFPFEPGRITWLPPDIPHEEDSESGYRNFHMLVKGFPRSATEVPTLMDPEGQPFLQVTQLLYREFHLRQTGWQKITRDLFHTLVLYIDRWEGRPAGHPLVERLRNLLLDNLHNPDFEVGAALRGLPMSSDHLRRLFFRDTGKTPVRYLSEIRVNEAKNLLAGGGFSVKEVARQVGCGDPYYFSRMFTKVAGSCPTAYQAGPQ